MKLQLRNSILVSISSSILVFAGYSIPTYFQLLAHQPSRNPAIATSYPPSYAFLIGGCLAMLTLVASGVIFLLVWCFCGFRKHL